MAERTNMHLLLDHMRQVAEIAGFGTAIPQESLEEAMGWDDGAVRLALNLLQEQGYVLQDSPVYGGGWWITGTGWDRLATLEFFGY